MKRITIDENIYARFKKLCSTNNSTQADMLETLIETYVKCNCGSASDSNEELIERVSSFEMELLELRNQLIS